MDSDDTDSIEADSAVEGETGMVMNVLQDSVGDIDRQRGKAWASAFACILYFSSFSEFSVAGEKTYLYLKWSDEHIFSN